MKKRCTQTLRATPLALLSGLLSLFQSLLAPSLFANQEYTDPEPPAPTLMVLYQDQSGNFSTRANDIGDLVLDVKYGQPIVLKDTSQQQIPLLEPLPLSQSKQVFNRGPSANKQMARVLIPFGAAALAFDGISNPELNFIGTDFQTNFGHFMVLASVNNLAKYVDEATAELLEEHHLGGVIPPEWAAKGAVAVLMFGAGVGAVGDKTQLSVGKSITMFSQFKAIDTSRLMLGEVSGQVLDRIVDLAPQTRQIVTAALGGALTGGLYCQLSAMMGNRQLTSELHSKISDSSLLGVKTAAIPFLEDFVSLATDNPLWKHVGTYSVLETMSLAAAGGLYALVNYYPAEEYGNSSLLYLTALMAGSFSQLAGMSAVEIVGNKSINLIYGDNENKLTMPSRAAIKAGVYLSASLAANALYRHYGYGAMANPLLRAALLKFRTGVYIAALTNGVTGLLDDAVQAIEQPRPVTVNLANGEVDDTK